MVFSGSPSKFKIQNLKLSNQISLQKQLFLVLPLPNMKIIIGKARATKQCALGMSSKKYFHSLNALSLMN